MNEAFPKGLRFLEIFLHSRQEKEQIVTDKDPEIQRQSRIRCTQTHQGAKTEFVNTTKLSFMVANLQLTPGDL